MGRILKNECARMFRSAEMGIVLLIGCGIAVWHFCQNVYMADFPMGQIPQNVFISWIGGHAHHMQTYWYFMIFPLLAVLPFAGSFYDDITSGYIRSVMLRSSRRNYFAGKGIAVFLSGGIAVSVPLILNFILTAMELPALRPDPYIGTGPRIQDFGGELFYLHPMVYTAVYLCIDFVMGGIMALLTAVCGYAVNFKFVALLAPFALQYMLYTLGRITNSNDYSLNFLLIPGIGIEKVRSAVLMLILAAGIMAVYIWKGRHYET